MTRHNLAILAINLIALLLIAGMLFGGVAKLPESLHIDRTIRDTSIALWAFVIPAWFTLEAAIFLPSSTADRAKFADGQRKGQMVATFFGTIVAIILGLSSLPASDAAAAFRNQAAPAPIANAQ